jgi:FkbH-like protein
MLTDVVERFMVSGSGDKDAGQRLFRWLKDELRAGNLQGVAETFPRLLIPGLDYTTATSLHRILNQLRAGGHAPERRTRIAVLGSATTHQLVDFLDLYLHAGGVEAELYEADYGTITQEILDPTSGLRHFAPTFVIICTTWRDLRSRPLLTDDAAEVARKVEAEVAAWSALWRVARDELNCQVIQSNFTAPPWRTLGNLDAQHPAGFSRFISLVNRALADQAPAGVIIQDVDGLAAEAGRWQWSDERFYHQAKLPCAPEYLTEYAHNLAALILAQLGAARKCLVLDLDNTLWGGVVGDDGLRGIRLGQGDPESEAFSSFQSYVKTLGERGVMLAVCSKNNSEIAREVFEKHPDMVLRLDDISCFVANWDDKPGNLKRIATELNIGLNALVFFDDNPAERSIVRQLVPEVAVPEVPDDPAYRIRALERYRYFETVAVSAEDLKRKEYYLANSERQALESSAGGLDEFLRSLEMVARIDSVSPANLERTVQLINRSNQFNLTTKRYTSAEIQKLMSSPNWVVRTISLRDRFGDNGLISVILARIEADSLVIDTWLMSCRVLKRGVEAVVMNHLAEVAAERGLVRMVGEYIPTPKNDLVREHYPKLGFQQLEGDPAGRTLWELRIDADWRSLTHFIKELVADERIAV